MPLCIADAFVAQRRRFNLLFSPGSDEPLRFRLLDDLLNAVSCDDLRELELHTYSFVCTITILRIRQPGEIRAWYDPPTMEGP